MKNEIFVQKTENRAKFIKESFIWGRIFEKIKDKKKILLKPNIVSFESYPTTTHPDTLRECLKLLLEVKPKDSILIADGPAFDVPNSEKIFENHPLVEVAREFEVPIVNLNTYKKRKIKFHNYTFLISLLAFEADFIISLPVLKAHKICYLTGALKNQYGFLAPRQKLFYHLPLKDLNRAIVLLNKIIKVDFFIVDAQKTLIFAQEKRHGGKEVELGYFLAGSDPFKLDLFGFSLLKEIDPRLSFLSEDQIPQIKIAKEMGFLVD